MNIENFPILEFNSNQTPSERGHIHGETLRAGIKELATIRKELAFNKNTQIKKRFKELALEQLEKNRIFDPNLTEELEAIAKSSNTNIEDLVMLNNYTDFRDLEIPNDEGCSTVSIKNRPFSLVGQTWDMHQSSKNYLCILKIPTKENGEQLILSLFGCLGLCGFNSNGLFIGVNNLNTQSNQSGIIWPALVRNLLQQKNISKTRKILNSAQITSGHAYLIADKSESEIWEVLPQKQQLVSQILPTQPNAVIFHTNHCLTKETKIFEIDNKISHTTHGRYNLLEKKLPTIGTLNSLEKTLTDHENYPLSICSHYAPEGAKDPSQTCGGVAAELGGQNYTFWKGCPKYDKDYKAHKFILNSEYQFKKVE